MKTVYCSTGEMIDTPAAVDRKSGLLYINPKLYFQLTDFQRKFVKFHEYGHYNLNTDSEIEADEYAFNQLAGTEFRSLKQCIECLEQLLDERKIGHKVRIDNMYRLAIKWDKEHTNKFSGTDKDTLGTANEGYAEVMVAAQAGNAKTLATAFNGLQNMLNTLIISAVLIVAMILIIKEER